ncbi:immunoglobulin superfamily member 1-like [Alligator mississippiensis]|uniref:immunoglobulin superfamily member 1-like n=1 Tax=Alligator mississippiensis TaxID=8496 RepID=UPI002877E323|nr:immunoglobulin superfamily member 1-like [Alligator mississippiensis]
MYPKPNISVSPSTIVGLGADVTIQCQGGYQNMMFLLHRVGNSSSVQDAEPSGKVAEFHINKVTRRDRGNYSCQYRNRSAPFIPSHPSDPVQLVVREPTAAPVLTTIVVITVVCLVVLLLLVAFTCYRKAQGRKNQALTWRSELMPPATQDHIYSLGSDRNWMDSPKPESPSANGIIYNKMNSKVFNAQRRIPPSSQSVIYTAVRVIQEAHRESSSAQ